MTVLRLCLNLPKQTVTVIPSAKLYILLSDTRYNFLLYSPMENLHKTLINLFHEKTRRSPTDYTTPSISWMFGNISPVTAEAGRGFLLRTEDSSSSTADSRWSHGHHPPPPLFQSVSQTELHRWSVITPLNWSPFSDSHFCGGLHCRPCTDSLRILKLRKKVHNIKLNTKGQLISGEPWQWQC